MGEDSGTKSSPCICLVSRDGEHVEVPLHIAKLSNLVTNAIEDDDDSSDSDSDNEESNTPQIVMIPNVTSDILQKVIEFCTYHETKEQMTPISTPLQSCKLEDLVQDWYVQFCHNVTPSSSNEGGHESGGDMTRGDNDEDKTSTASSTTTTTNQLFELVAAANYMDIKPLLDLTCLAVSVWIKGKSAEEITQMFQLNLNIGDDGGKGTSASSSVSVSVSKEEEDETKWCDKPTVH